MILQRRRLKEKHPKVRTGCLTCKARHVKCDENRPVCSRCRRGGYKCEGYIDPPKAWVFEYSGDSDKSTKEDSSSNDQSDPSLSLDDTADREQTEPTSDQDSDAGSDQTRSVVKVLAEAQRRFLLQPGSPYRTSDEQRTIKRFLEVTGPMLCRYSDPEVWLVGIPQSAWNHNAVRSSLMAATLVDEEAAVAVRRPVRSEKILIHLNSALRATLSERPSLEVVLMVALVLQLFETLNHRAYVALIHLRSARKILDEFKRRTDKGEHGNSTQADFILGRLEPVLVVAEQFAAATLDKDIDKAHIDQHSTDAYALREKLTRPGMTDAFRDLHDARNNLGSQAIKLAQSLNQMQQAHALNKDNSTTDGPSRQRLPTTLSQQHYMDAEARLDHFSRLFQPISEKHDALARMIHVHYRIIKMMLDDVKPNESRSYKPLPCQVKGFCDDTVNQTISLITDTSIKQSEDLKVELGLIPPLFYLATTTRLCANISRRQAIHCLQTGLRERREGAWSGAIAARVAEEMVDLGQELSSNFATTRVHFEVSHRSQDFAGYDRLAPARAKDGLELWIGYDAVLRPSSSADQEAISEVKTHTRKCLTWTSDEIKRLPKNINELIRNAGYQGYFSDAAAAAMPSNVPTV